MQAKLTAEMLNDIVSNLKSDNSGTRSSDKRAQGRVGLRGLLDVVPCTFNKEANKPLSVWVRDISVNGLGLMTPQRFDDGMEFIARFVREGRSPLCLLYKVRYCRRVTGELLSVGASFVRVMPDSNGEVAVIGKPKRVKAGAAAAE